MLYYLTVGKIVTVYKNRKMEDKRKFPRVNISFPIRCEGIKSRKDFYTVFKDISKGGVKLISNQFLALNKQLKFEINLIDKFIQGKGRVAWCNALPYSERYTAGIEFTEINSRNEKELSDFLTGITPS